MKHEFLSNFRLARNLFFHPQVDVVGQASSTEAQALALSRAALWLTPKSVAGFDIHDFPELRVQQQTELATAVDDFLAIARQVPSDQPASRTQHQQAQAAFQRILVILQPYLPVPEEARSIELALSAVELPSWVVNWDFELTSDSEGMPAVWVSLYVDQERAPLGQMGRFVTDITTPVRSALIHVGVDRWPYIRIRSAQAHRAPV